jgi:hypothetical protein
MRLYILYSHARLRQAITRLRLQVLGAFPAYHKPGWFILYTCRLMEQNFVCHHGTADIERVDQEICLVHHHLRQRCSRPQRRFHVGAMYAVCEDLSSQSPRDVLAQDLPNPV